MRITVVIAILLTASFTAVILWIEVLHSSSFELVFFDVGQGDAIYLETPQGHQILIDGGPDESVLSRLGKVMPFWDKSLDLLLLTHPEADHLRGSFEALEHYQVSQVLWTGVEKDTNVFNAWKEEMEKEGAKVTYALAGQKIYWGESKEEFLGILYPRGEDLKDNSKANESSIIAKLEYRGTSVLFTGDTTKKIENLLLDLGINVKADILKVAHHGSNTSSSKEFIEAVSPKTAVISTGKDNSFGHPTLEILARLAKYDINIRRTDKEGNIFFYLK